jgi:hypothetical protein
VVACLTRADALALLDWHGPPGPRALQEEYVEWRVVRSRKAIRRIELTTELADYWRILAAHEPDRTLELVAAFAGRERIDPSDVYGSCDPHARGVSAGKRAHAFEATMLRTGAMSPYNDGRRAICCMVQPTNTLYALLALTCAATTPQVVRDVVSGRRRCLTCDEAIPLMSGKAMRGRTSDPVLVERLGRLAFEGRLVALDDPFGIVIAGFEHARLGTRDGDIVPAEWFAFSRGAGARESPTGRPLHQRLVLEVPPGTGLTVSDLVDSATEQPIRHGGQIADMAQIALHLRVSGPDAVPVDLPEPTELIEAEDDGRDCETVRRQFASFTRRP